MKYQLTKEYIIALMLSLGGDGTTPQSTGEHRSAGLQSKLCQKQLQQKTELTTDFIKVIN